MLVFEEDEPYLLYEVAVYLYTIADLETDGGETAISTTYLRFLY